MELTKLGNFNANAWCPLCSHHKYFNEDCLCLNIWRPKKINKKLLPVMVYLSYFHDNPDLSDLNPSIVVNTTNSIRITLNFRVGPLGFASMPEIYKKGKGTGGANGLLDQITALKFIKKHILNFGGDPDNISLYGSSTGASCICALIVSPLTKNLVKRAIIESGNCIGIWGPHSWEDGYLKTKLLLDKLKITTLSELKKFPLNLIK